MAAQKLAQSDIDIIQNSVNRVHYYALRDARQTHIAGKPKTQGKLNFDRQYYHHVMVILTAIKALTGIEPQELAETNANSFFQRFGVHVEDFNAQPQPLRIEDDSTPF